jgi:hypothetical protein
MTPIPEEELKQIVERDLPGYTLAQEQPTDAPRARRVEPDEVAPDIERLREKYLGTRRAADPQPDAATRPRRRARRAADADDDNDDVIVSVRRTAAADPLSPESRPKTVVVSGRDRRIVGSQG